MTTIVDVARHAAVSIDTVSRVMRRDPSVRTPTRRAVLQAIEELGYIPNSAARSLRSARSNTIGLVIPDLSRWGYYDATLGITAEVRKHGYSLILCDSEGTPEVEAANLRRLYERRVEGLIVGLVDQTSKELQLFLSAGTPVVLVGWGAAFPGVPQLSLNRRESLKAAVEYLAGLGHTRIGIVDVTAPGYLLPDGVHGEVVSKAGLSFDPSLVVRVTNWDRCSSAMAALLGRPDRPTAIVSGGHIAPFVLEGIYHVGLEIPRELSFVSLGDSPWAAIHSPPITVVSHDNVERGVKAIEYVFARLEGRDAEGLLAEARSKVRVRASCRPIAGPQGSEGAAG